MRLTVVGAAVIIVAALGAVLLLRRLSTADGRAPEDGDPP